MDSTNYLTATPIAAVVVPGGIKSFDPPPPTEQQLDVWDCLDALGQITRQLRPYDHGDLADPITRARYYAMRSRAVLREATEGR